MPAEYTYDYAIIRVVPRVDRGEQINVGVILSCADTDFLDARIELDESLVLALDPEVDLDAGNIFHTAPSWFFTDDEALEGTWGVETPIPGIYRCGSSVLRGGAVSGIPGRNAAMRALEEASEARR